MVDERKKHDSGRGFNFGNDFVELCKVTDKRINVLNRGDALILSGSRARCGNEGLSGCVRHKMEVKVVSSQCFSLLFTGGGAKA